jgi:hypothetical protein
MYLAGSKNRAIAVKLAGASQLIGVLLIYPPIRAGKFT